MKKINSLTLALLLSLSSNQLLAADSEDSPNPSDITEVSTSAYFGINNQGGVKGSIARGFGFSEKTEGMITIEAAIDKEGHYSDSRFQYFQVFNTKNHVVPKAAVSLDVMDNDMFTSASLGSVIAINPGVKGLSIFPRAGVLAGEYSDSSVNQFNVSDRGTTGASAALYVSYTMGNDGTYIMVSPEYNYLGGDIETSMLKTSVKMGTPFSQDKTRWGEIRLENTDMKMESASKKIKNNDTVVWANYKFYF